MNKELKIKFSVDDNNKAALVFDNFNCSNNDIANMLRDIMIKATTTGLISKGVLREVVVDIINEIS